MTFDVSILDDTAARSARLVALTLLEDLARERERLGAARDSETLHDFRVALRRLRSWLRALGPSLEGSLPDAAVRRLRRMARESNAGRDAEVFLAWLTSVEPQLAPRERRAARWLIERFQRQEREAESELEGRLKRDFRRTCDRLAERLSIYHVEAHVHAGVQEPLFSTVTAVLLRDMGEEFRRRLKRIRSVDDINESHQARIAGKRLRYVLEPIAQQVVAGPALLMQLRSLQDTLGDLHDAHVWLMVLRNVVAELAMEEGRQMASALTAGQRGKKRASKAPPRAGLVALARLAHERAESAFDRFHTEWVESGGREFHQSIQDLAERLAERNPTQLEIERKFLLKRLPESVPAATTLVIEQGYLPGERLVERLRAVEVDGQRTYYRTVKVGAGLVRTELEEETSLEVFKTLWPLTKGKRLTKRRHRVPDGSLALTWEIDEFTDRSLVLAEIELPSADTEVEIPKWLAPFVEREVTGDVAYLNSTLAK